MQEVHDAEAIDMLATIQAQLTVLQTQGAATATPAFSSSMYAISVSSPTNTINLQVQHTATVGDLLTSAFFLLAVMAVLLKYIFNGMRGIGL